MASVGRKATVSGGGSMDRLKQFLQETWLELRYKVTWPDPKTQLVKSTMVVLTVVVVVSIFIYLLDVAYGYVLRNTLLRP